MRVLDIFQTPLVALDVGTATTRVSFGDARVFEHPSVVHEDVRGEVVTRSTVRSGVVADIAGAASVINELLASRKRWQRRPGALVCAPSDISASERDTLIEAVAEGGASVTAVVPEPLAAAIGAGADVASEYATAVVDIGEGVTDFAVFRNASIVHSRANRVGCGTLRAALRDCLELREQHPVTDDALESAVRAYCHGAAHAPIGLTRDEVESLLEPEIDAIATFVASSFRDLPDALAAEVIESGIHLTGGGAKLERLVARVEKKVGLPLIRAREPLGAVIRGARAMLHNRRLLAD